jgi:hypothetical protein
MTDVITIGKRLIPIEQIAFVEPFDPASNPNLKTDKAFKARVVLLNRDMVLAEFSPPEFAEAHGFRMLADDDTAINPRIAFQVERYSPSDNFPTTKPYETRVKWSDVEHNPQSKLLLTKPETIIALVLRDDVRPVGAKTGARRPKRSRGTQRGKLEMARG